MRSMMPGAGYMMQKPSCGTPDARTERNGFIASLLLVKCVGRRAKSPTANCQVPSEYVCGQFWQGQPRVAWSSPRAGSTTTTDAVIARRL